MDHVLLACVDDRVRARLREVLLGAGLETTAAANADEALAAHREHGADLVVAVLPLPGMGSARLLSRVRAEDRRAVVLLCGTDDETRGPSDAAELGAFDHIGDPFADEARTLSLVKLGLEANRNQSELRYLRERDAAGTSWQAIVGHAPAMREVFAKVRSVCQRTLRGGAPTVLILGETGTGKGLIARALHYNGARRSRAFVVLNCAAVPETLLEAELFGHEPGAFTDARSRRAGLFELADRGTLFLDEIGALPPALQPKLLTALEDGAIRRLGGDKSVVVNVQIVAATNRDLGAMVEAAAFRADLYHRLNVVALTLPPLRDRGDDRLLIARELLAAHCREYGVEPRRLDESAERAITDYSWPGNVRELRNRLERAVILTDGDITAQHLDLPSDRRVAVASDGGRLSVSLPEQAFSFGDLEREVYLAALARHPGNVSAAARYLGLGRLAFVYRLKKHGIDAAAIKHGDPTRGRG